MKVRGGGSRSVNAAQGLRRLSTKDPAAARRITAAGATIARARNLGLEVGTRTIAGPGAGSLLRRGYRSPYYDPGYPSYYCGYGYYPWGFGYHGGDWYFHFGFGFPSYWYYWPFYYCYWYPYWWGHHYYYPYYYYPYHYSTVVYHHYYEDDYDDGGDTIIYVDSEPDQEYVGEGVVAEDVGAAPAEEQLDTAAYSLRTAAQRYLTLGDQAFREGRFSDAVQFYAKAVEFAPEEGVLHLVLADALFATGDYHYAAYSLRKALELDPSLADAVIDKHEFYSDPAEFDRQLARLETHLETSPADQDARLVLAANYLFGNRPATAVDLLESKLAASLRLDEAANLVLQSARKVQFGRESEIGADTGDEQ